VSRRCQRNVNNIPVELFHGGGAMCVANGWRVGTAENVG